MLVRSRDIVSQPAYTHPTSFLRLERAYEGAPPTVGLGVHVQSPIEQDGDGLAHLRRDGTLVLQDVVKGREAVVPSWATEVGPGIKERSNGVWPGPEGCFVKRCLALRVAQVDLGAVGEQGVNCRDVAGLRGDMERGSTLERVGFEGVDI